MSRRIKFHAFHVLFRLFAFLANKSGGWRVFVRPKLLIGSIILGLGLSGCGAKTDKRNSETSKNGLKDSIKRVEVNQDSTVLDNQPPQLKSTMCYFTAPVIKEENKLSEPMVTCYDTEIRIEPTDSNGVYEVVEQMPQFPGGVDSLLLYIAKNIKYPGNESLQNINGKVVCRFVINKDGSVSNIEVMRSLDPILDTIAINVIKSMPDFIPGRQNGKIVRTYYTLPIHFRTQE